MSNIALSKAFALALALSLAAPVSFAQTVPSLGAPAIKVPSEAEAALGRQLVVASGLNESFLSAIAGMMDQLGRTLTRTRPDDAFVKELQAAMRQLEPDFLKEADSLVDGAGKIVASQLSEQEMKDALAFFNSPSGKKYVGAQPLIFSSISLASQSWRDHVSSVIMDRVRVEMKKKGYDF